MKIFTSCLIALLVLSLAFSAVAGTTHYVDLNSTNATLPYLTWNTAATTIQDAIDAAVDGDLVWVADGIYQTGGRVVYGALTNRVVVDKAVTVQSVNGAASTTIQGNRAVGTNGVRCIYLTNNASLIGFTLANGASLNAGDVYMEQSGGGAWCESTNCALINCIFVSNAVAQFGGGAFSGTCSNCLFVFNVATTGGGAFGGILNYCTLATNSAGNAGGASSNTLNYCALIANKGGGAYGSRLNFCTVSWNTNSNFGAGMNSCVAVSCLVSNNTIGLFGSNGAGGGAYNSSLTNCMIMNNSAGNGGGAAICFLTNCTLSGNVASAYLNPSSGLGPGAFQSTLYNCILISNRVSIGQSFYPSAVYGGTLNNCTIVGHTNGLAALGSTMNNCIIYYNKSNGGALCVNCCITPLPSGTDNGGGNFTNAPLFVDFAGGDYHLQSNSPCINAGSNSYAATTTDFDGNPRVAGSRVDVGVYEYQTPSSVLSYAWAQQYGLPTDGSVDFADTDGDLMSNYTEWIAGTIPTNAASALRMNPPSKAATGLRVTWQTVGGKTYFLQRATNLLGSPAFTTIRMNIHSISGGTITDVDTTATNDGPYFYRVGLQ